MGSSLSRSRFWWYRSLYDDYCGREMRLAFGIASFIWLPHYWWGLRVNREAEVHFSHRNYSLEYGPRRNRLAHSLLFEEFDVILENWANLEDEYKEKSEEMLKSVEPGQII